MYDLLVVGAGISSATLCAELKATHRILVIDTRSHLGGNCYDRKSQGTLVHQYGAHLFHTANPKIVEFLSRFTAWTPYSHSVTGEIRHNGELIRVPFPYSGETVRAIGHSLSPEEVIDAFFKGYSQLMWGRPWGELPESIKGRVPKDTREHSDYFPDQFVGLPKLGYTHMLENMFDGVEMILGADPEAWYSFLPQAKQAVYCGRPDRLRIRPDAHGIFMGGSTIRPQTSTARGLYGWLDHVSLDITFRTEDWSNPAPVLNYCHGEGPYTRAVCHRALTGGESRLVSYERPIHHVGNTDVAPFYPVPDEDNRERLKYLKDRVSNAYPGLHLLGRLATGQYLDMHMAVGAALKLAATLKAP